MATLIPIVKGPTAVSSTDVLTLSAEDSVDPNFLNKTAHFSWLVLDSDGLVPFSNGVNINNQLNRKNKTFTVNVGQYFKSGRRYNFELTYRVGNRKSIAYHTVQIVKGNPPIIEPTLFPKKINPSKRFVIEALIKSKSQLLNVSWFSDVKGRYTGKRFTRYFVDENVMQGGSTYNFTVCATNHDAEACYDIEVETNNPPTLGRSISVIIQI